MLQVQRWDAERDGVLTASRVRRRFEAQGLWVSETRLQPGAGHIARGTAHDLLQIVLSGLIKVTIGGDAAASSASCTCGLWPRSSQTRAGESIPTIVTGWAFTCPRLQSES